MNAVPPDFPPAGRAPAGQLGQADALGAADEIRLKWDALHEAGAIVAELAGEDLGQDSLEIRAFPRAIAETGGWQARLARQGLDDLVAIMEPGIAALLAVNERGADTQVPAQTLWHEFDAARGALLALVVPAEELDPLPDA